MTPPAGPPLLALDGGGRATITLQRPHHLNRLHREDLLALRGHLQRVAAQPGVRVLVLTGSGRAFCAGFHLGELEESESSASDDPQLFEHTVDALEALPVPTIARLNGGVFGGATDLALACDFRIGVEDMQLRMPAARLGLHYYPSGLRRYVSRLGLAAAKRLFLLAETVSADELLRIGYLDALVPAERLDAEVAEQKDAIAGLCTKIGYRLCELGQDEAVALPDDAQLDALISAVRDAQDKIKELRAETDDNEPELEA
ncbi:MAG: enoyl-CoA hydratase/isomerase family protein, partial [Rubrivivax sp.]|nr:enoyl-CoA hydratase/isomerase family protein [Rubrivivax sp.]